MINEQGRRLWHTTPKPVEMKRHFEPISMTAALAGLTAAAGTAGVGAGLWGLFGGGRKKKSTEQADPLAGIRLQLQGLAGQIPGLVARQKEQTAKQIAGFKEEGYENIGENVYGERGFGKTSIEDRLRTELATKLAETQSAADLNAEKWGLGAQADILQGTSTMYPDAPAGAEEESWLTTLGQALGASFGGGNTDFGDITDFISKTGVGKKGTADYSDLGITAEDIKKRQGTYTLNSSLLPSYGTQ